MYLAVSTARSWPLNPPCDYAMLPTRLDVNTLLDEILSLDGKLTEFTRTKRQWNQADNQVNISSVLTFPMRAARTWPNQ